jgi:hypothetical protein
MKRTHIHVSVESLSESIRFHIQRELRAIGERPPEGPNEQH